MNATWAACPRPSVTALGAAPVFDCIDAVVNVRMETSALTQDASSNSSSCAGECIRVRARRLWYRASSPEHEDDEFWAARIEQPAVSTIR